MPNCIFETSDHIMRDQSKQSVRQYCKLIGCAGIFYIFYIRYGRSSSLLFRHDGLHSARFCACLHEILHHYCCISLTFIRLNPKRHKKSAYRHAVYVFWKEGDWKVSWRTWAVTIFYISLAPPWQFVVSGRPSIKGDVRPFFPHSLIRIQHVWTW